jgi:hypothetical protein
LTSERLNFVCTTCLIKDSVWTGTHIVWTVAAILPYLYFGTKSFSLSNTERRPAVLLRRLDGCNLDQFEASGHRGASGWKDLVVWTDDALIDERPDEIPCRPDGCKGTELHCFEFYIESS